MSNGWRWARPWLSVRPRLSRRWRRRHCADERLHDRDREVAQAQVKARGRSAAAGAELPWIADRLPFACLFDCERSSAIAPNSEEIHSASCSSRWVHNYKVALTLDYEGQHARAWRGALWSCP